jgi:hypothetical protein
VSEKYGIKVGNIKNGNRVGGYEKLSIDELNETTDDFYEFAFERFIGALENDQAMLIHLQASDFIDKFNLLCLKTASIDSNDVCITINPF